MIGSYGPRPEAYVKRFATEEAPSGMLARSGSNTVRSRVIDDDGNVFADWWVICVISLISVARKETDESVTGPGFSKLPKTGNDLLFQPPSAVKPSIVPLTPNRSRASYFFFSSHITVTRRHRHRLPFTCPLLFLTFLVLSPQFQVAEAMTFIESKANAK